MKITWAAYGGPTLPGTLVQRWRAWQRKRTCASELAALGPEEVARLAQDSGLTGNQLRTLAGKWPDSAEPLGRRLDALYLDEEQIGRHDPAALRDLQRVCSMCASKGRCDHDLLQEPYDPVWREYCPNVQTLDALVADSAPPRRR